MLQSLRQGLQNLRWSGRFVTRDRAGLFPLRFFAQMQMGTHLLLLTIPLTVAPLAASFAWREKNKNKNKTLLSSENASLRRQQERFFSSVSGKGERTRKAKGFLCFGRARRTAPHRAASPCSQCHLPAGAARGPLLLRDAIREGSAQPGLLPAAGRG